MGYWLVTELKFVTNQTSYITGSLHEDYPVYHWLVFTSPTTTSPITVFSSIGLGLIFVFHPAPGDRSGVTPLLEM